MNDCLEFNGKRTNGYGKINVDGRFKRLHRLSYEEFKGKIPENLIVRHTCDNKACWNPEHLELGTHKDNSKDMVDRGRSTKGTNIGSSKLTVDKVKEIKTLLSNPNLKQEELAQKYSVSREMISSIKNGRCWKNVV